HRTIKRHTHNFIAGEPTQKPTRKRERMVARQINNVRHTLALSPVKIPTNHLQQNITIAVIARTDAAQMAKGVNRNRRITPCVQNRLRGDAPAKTAALPQYHAL